MKTYKTLVVDNNPVLRRVIANILEQAGCEVRTAENGLDALKVLTGYRPDILFIDLIMPRIDGEKLIRILRASAVYREMFLVILSGVAMEDGNKVLDMVADFCIAKGPAVTMKEHILKALEMYAKGGRDRTAIAGQESLFPREVTRELLQITRHDQVIFDHMTEGMIEMNEESLIVRVNRVACELFEREEAELLSASFLDLLDSRAADIYGKWHRTLQNDEPAPLVFPYQDPLFINGRYLICSLIPIIEDEHCSILGLLEDVTGRKLLDEKQQLLDKERERIRKLEAMANMASGIAHDFNNLLTIINGNVEMAKILSTEEQVTGLLAETEKALRLTTGLIKRFSTFSDNYLPSKTRIGIRTFLEELVPGELAATGISFRIETDGGDQQVECDPDLMAQVFANIVHNSVEAMEDGGTITIRIRTLNCSSTPCPGPPLEPGLYAQISVTDTGIGIDQTILDKVFDPYFSTKQKGTQKGMGLGLTIAHAIVKKHGGAIWLEPGTARGCTTHVCLPLARRVKAMEAGTSQFRVLVQAGDAAREGMGEVLAANGCDPVFAGSWQETVEVFTRCWQGRAGIDLVLVDLEDGGQMAAEAIHSLSPETILVAMAGDSSCGQEADPMLRRNGIVRIVGPDLTGESVRHLVNLCVRQATG